MSITLKTWKAFFDTGESFTSLFTPVDYEDGRFILRDGSIGQVWEVGGFPVDGRSTSELEGYSFKLKNFLNSLPEGFLYQVITVGFRGNERIKKEIRDTLKPDNPAMKELLDFNLEMYEKSLYRGFFSYNEINFYPKTITTLFTVRYFPFRDNGTSRISVQSRVDEKIESTFTMNNISHRKFYPQDMINLHYRLLNPRTTFKRPPPLDNHLPPICNKFLFNSPELKNCEWVFEGIRTRVITFKEPPVGARQREEAGEFRTVFVTEPNMLFEEKPDGISLYDITDNFIFAVNFFKPSQTQMESYMKRRKAFAWLHSAGLMGDVAVEKDIIKKECDSLIDKTYSSGDKYFKASFIFVILGDDEEIDAKSTKFVSFLESAGTIPIVEDMNSPAMFLQALPLSYDPELPSEKDVLKKTFTFLGSNIADLLPLYRNSSGSKSVTDFYYNRRGEIIYLDLFDSFTSSTAPHCLVTGMTGGGKSVTMSKHIMMALARGGIVFVIDKKDTYERLTRFAGGQHIRFEGEIDFILDPFRGDRDDDHRVFLTHLLSMMATGGTEAITREEVAVLSESVLECFRSSESPSIETVAEILKRKDDIGLKLSRKIKPFYGDGQYARFYSGDKPPLDFKGNRLISFQLGDIDLYKDFFAVNVMLLIYYIKQFVKKNPGVMKYLIIDEAWQLFNDPITLMFLVEVVKTFRSFGCAVIFVTQQLDDFKGVAEVLKDNCPNKILLTQNVDTIERNREALGLSDGVLSYYRTLTKQRNFNEILIKTEGWCTIVRVLLDPFSYWVTTSRDQDKAYLSRLEKEYGLRDAIMTAARENPYGVSY
ncbi:MAG: ATP-binding protein [Nitrospirota bacterium]